jgi:hypothetical protein
MSASVCLFWIFLKHPMARVFENGHRGIRRYKRCPSTSPFAFSPPIARTGMVSLVFESSAKSLVACRKETKYAQPARILPGRA